MVGSCLKYNLGAFESRVKRDLLGNLAPSSTTSSLNIRWSSASLSIKTKNSYLIISFYICGVCRFVTPVSLKYDILHFWKYTHSFCAYVLNKQAMHKHT